MISPKRFKLGDPDSWIWGYRSHGGYFGLMSVDGYCDHLVTCREELSWTFRKTHERLVFKRTDLNVERLDRFLTTMTVKLNVDPIVIHRTCKADTVVLELPLFWRANSTNRSLLSLLIRCGAVYYSGNIEDALQAYNISRRCTPAIKWFLKGYTKPTYKSLRAGFADFFASASPDTLARRLVKP